MNQVPTMTTKKTIWEKWKAGYPAIYLLSTETPMIMGDIRAVAKERTDHERAMSKKNGEPPANYHCFSWTLGKGVIDEFSKKAQPIQSTDGPEDVLKFIADQIPRDSIIVLKDFHHFLDAPLVQAMIKDLLQPFKMTQRTLVILSPVLKIPEELKKDVALVDTVLPGLEELEIVLDGVVSGSGLTGASVPTGDLRRLLLEAALGLTTSEAENAFGLTLVRCRNTDRVWDPIVVLNEKCQSLKKDGLLEYYPPGTETLASIGGMDELKEWVIRRKNGFTQAARDFGCEAPNGILMLGIPGTGKSLGAKAVAGAFDLPLLRCDMGKIFGSLVGESEANIRKIILTAEAVSPCVLWLN